MVKANFAAQNLTTHTEMLAVMIGVIQKLDSNAGYLFQESAVYISMSN